MYIRLSLKPIPGSAAHKLDPSLTTKRSGLTNRAVTCILPLPSINSLQKRPSTIKGSPVISSHHRNWSSLHPVPASPSPSATLLLSPCSNFASHLRSAFSAMVWHCFSRAVFHRCIMLAKTVASLLPSKSPYASHLAVEIILVFSLMLHLRARQLGPLPPARLRNPCRSRPCLVAKLAGSIVEIMPA